MKSSNAIVGVERIQTAIHIIRGERVIADRELASLYGVATKVFNQAVKRHKDRFPDDFMFRLTTEESKDWWRETMSERLRSQSVTLKRGQHIKYRPLVFTEHGILMLSSVLASERAVKVNIEIMREFVRLRKFVMAHTELTAKLAELERRVVTHDGDIQAIFTAIRQLMTPPAVKVKQIGFRSKALK